MSDYRNRGQDPAILCQEQRSLAENAGKLVRAAFLGLLLIVSTLLATGCGGDASGRELDIADIGWTENAAIAELTKVLLEEELGYEQVTIHTRNPSTQCTIAWPGGTWTHSRTCGCRTSETCSATSRTTSSNLASPIKARPNRA